MQKIGIPKQEIARLYNVDRTTIWKYLKEFQVDNKELRSFESGLQDEVLKSLLDDLNLAKRVVNYFNNLGDDEFRKLTPNTLLTLKRSNDIGIGIKIEKYRLAAGLSTSNIAYIDALKAHEYHVNRLQTIDSLDERYDKIIG